MTIKNVVNKYGSIQNIVMDTSDDLKFFGLIFAKNHVTTSPARQSSSIPKDIDIHYLTKYVCDLDKYKYENNNVIIPFKELTPEWIIYRTFRIGGDVVTKLLSIKPEKLSFNEISNFFTATYGAVKVQKLLEIRNQVMHGYISQITKGIIVENKISGIYHVITGRKPTSPGFYLVNPKLEKNLNIPDGVGKYLIASVDGIDGDNVVEYKHPKYLTYIEKNWNSHYNKLQWYMGITGRKTSYLLAYKNDPNADESIKFQRTDILTKTRMWNVKFDQKYWDQMISHVSKCIKYMYEPYIKHITGDQMGQIPIMPNIATK